MANKIEKKKKEKKKRPANERISSNVKKRERKIKRVNTMRASRICFLCLSFLLLLCVWQQSALKQRFVFAVHGFMMRFHFLLCLCLFIAIIPILPSIFNQHCVFCCYSPSIRWSTDSYCSFDVVRFFNVTLLNCEPHLFSFLLTLHTFSCAIRTHTPVCDGFFRFLLFFGAFQCRFHALIFVAYYILHLIRQIVVTASFNNPR